MDEKMIKTMNETQKLVDTRQQRKEQNESYPYNGYTILMVTNLLHEHPDHPPQVIYKGDNGKCWSLELSKWPGNLEPETEENFKKVPVVFEIPTIKELMLCLPDEHKIKILELIDNAQSSLQGCETCEIEAQYKAISEEVKKWWY